MFGVFEKKESQFDGAIERLLFEMDAKGPDTQEYTDMMEHLVKLANIRKEERPGKVSVDTIALVAGNLLGILVIVAYEQKHVMVSKGLSFLLKPR